MLDTSKIIEPHKNQPVLQSGAAKNEAKAVMIMLHGRGATAESILSFADKFVFPNVTYLAPQAKVNTWYPYRFIEPREKNEPGITSGLQLIESIISQLNQKGFSTEKIILFGFSQGACLALEYAARNPHKYGGIIGLSGGLIGDKLNYSNYTGSFHQTHVFLGCSEIDFHIPIERVKETTKIFKLLNASVIEKIYPGMDHTINEEEIEIVSGMIKNVISKQ